MVETSAEELKQARIANVRARNISKNVRCTECGSQSIEDSQADIAVILRKLIRDEVQAGKSDREIYKKLEDEFGETVLYAPKFDWQTAALWLSPVLFAAAGGSIWAFRSYRRKSNVQKMISDCLTEVPLTVKERETMIEILTPPPKLRNPSFWWNRRLGK